MIRTNAIYKVNRPNNYGKSNSNNDKWRLYLKDGWIALKNEKRTSKKNPITEGEGLTILPSDPNALLERLDLLLAS